MGPKQRSRGPRTPVAAGLLVLLVAVAALAAARAGEEDGTARPSGDTRVVGVVANTLEGGSEAQDTVRDAGIRWVREELRWADLEPQRGRFDWRDADALLRATAARGLRVLPLLIDTPRWLGARNELPPDHAAFARFAAAAAQRYGPGGTFWQANPSLDADLAPVWFEVWNEPWFGAFSAGGIRPAAFAALARTTVLTGRRANPRTRWLVPLEGPYERDDGAIADWVDDVAAATPDLGQVADGFAVHPYDVDDPRTAAGDLRGEFARIDRVRAGLRRHGWRTGRLWITEIGWSTCTRRPLCVSEADQRRHWTSLLNLVRAAPDVRAVFAYHLFGTGDPAPRTSGNHYGLLRHDGSRKPAYDVVVAAARRSAR